MSSSQAVSPNDQIPTVLTSLVGREHDVTAVCTLLRQDARLVTLIGPGGVGKTRLAMEVATALRPEFADGVCYVSLAPITDPELVVPTVAFALGLQDRGVRTPWANLISHLREKRLLLVLDNFEQVSSVAQILSDLVAGCPSLRILVTSRAVLRLSIEREYVVSPLDLPGSADIESTDWLSRSAAVTLF